MRLGGGDREAYGEVVRLLEDQEGPRKTFRDKMRLLSRSWPGGSQARAHKRRALDEHAAEEAQTKCFGETLEARETLRVREEEETGKKRVRDSHADDAAQGGDRSGGSHETDSITRQAPMKKLRGEVEIKRSSSGL